MKQALDELISQFSAYLWLHTPPHFGLRTHADSTHLNFVVVGAGQECVGSVQLVALCECKDVELSRLAWKKTGDCLAAMGIKRKVEAWASL